MKYCFEKKDIPVGDHYVILEFDTIHTEGDERSRTHPGHGYPASSTNVQQGYIAFTDKAEWEAEITKRMTSKYGRKDFVAKTAEIITTHSVKAN